MLQEVQPYKDGVIMATQDIHNNIQLSNKAIRRIHALRDMEKDGTSHEKFFLEVLTIISSKMSNLVDAEENRRFRILFDTLTYYSETLTSIVEE